MAPRPGLTAHRSKPSVRSRQDFYSFNRMRHGPNGMGLSRKAIMTEIDNSLRRLGSDYVDLYQIHRLDPITPIEETLEALHDVVKAGKARYIGASSMYTWQFAKAVFTSRLHGWTEFVSMQNHVNLLNREEEREMLPFCADQGIGVIPWSPLARGRLTRDWDETSERQQTDEFWQGSLYAGCRCRSRRGRRGRPSCRETRGPPCAGGAGLGRSERCRDRADHRCIQAEPSNRCRRGIVAPALGGRDCGAGGALRSPPDRGMPMSSVLLGAYFGEAQIGFS